MCKTTQRRWALIQMWVYESHTSHDDVITYHVCLFWRVSPQPIATAIPMILETSHALERHTRLMRDMLDTHILAQPKHVLVDWALERVGTDHSREVQESGSVGEGIAKEQFTAAPTKQLSHDRDKHSRAQSTFTTMLPSWHTGCVRRRVKRVTGSVHVIHCMCGQDRG